MATYRLVVTVSPQSGGEVSLDGVNYQASIDSTVTERPQRTVYARANPGYIFKHFADGRQGIIYNDNPCVFWQNLYEDALTAVFEQATPPTYTITTASSPVGGGTTTGDGTYSAGASCTITATPAAGYIFVRWEKNGSQVSTSASYTFTVSESATYTAVFEAATTATITIVARNGWGHVQFEGETPTTGTASKTVPIGTSVVMEAIESGTAHFSSWSGPGTGTTNKRLVRVVRTDETWTANFYYLCAAKVAQIADWTTPSPVGEVRAVDVDGATDWGNDVNRRINHGTQFSVEQRESLQGWHFVKWRYRTIGDWQETSEETLNFRYMTNLEAVALFKRTPTHLLVNGSTVESPAKLVYDPATNKLVADY